MATYTWVDLQIPEAAKLADLNGIQWDLQRAREFAEMLSQELSSSKPNWHLVEPLSIATVVTYSRPFSSGVRSRLGETDLKVFTPEQRSTHDFIRQYRDKHVAHSVNVFEENIPRATYCLERVQEEGITGIGYGGGRVTALSGKEVNAIIELTKLLESQIQAQIAVEQNYLLTLVRSMPLEKVLAGGQKAFVTVSGDVGVRRVS